MILRLDYISKPDNTLKVGIGRFYLGEAMQKPF